MYKTNDNKLQITRFIHQHIAGYAITSSVWSQSLTHRSRNIILDEHMTEANYSFLQTATEAKFLLVIEKQGIFQRLCEDNFHR